MQSFSIDALDTTRLFCRNNNLEFGKLNTVVLYGVEKYCGWASNNGTLYTNEKYPVKNNVDVNSITEELSKVIDLDVTAVPSQIYANDEDISYEIVSTQEYVRKNEKCIGYRVFINVKNASDSQLLNIYKKITQDDSYYLHTVWYYYNKSSADGSGTANAIIEQTVPDINPIDVERN